MSKPITLLLTQPHAQTVRKALVNQLQRAKQNGDTNEIQRIKDVLNTIDLKESLEVAHG